MQLTLFPILSARLVRIFRYEKCLCFHCAERMRKEGALMATFQQVQQPVCCYGCLAILNTIEKNGLVAEYLQSKHKSDASD